MSAPDDVRPFPVFRTDEEAEAFVDGADLSHYDFSQFSRVHFEFGQAQAPTDVKLPKSLIDALTNKAKLRGISLESYIRKLLEHDVADLQP